jgi:hypothetical protein
LLWVVTIPLKQFTLFGQFGIQRKH